MHFQDRSGRGLRHGAERASGLAALLLLTPALHAAQAQDSASSARKAVTAARVPTPAVIDGKLDEGWWADAGLIDDFTQIRPGDGTPPSERTEVLVAYDADYLYIGARFHDRAGKDGISAKIMRQGERLQSDDRLAVILDPFNTGRGGYRFEVNLNSVRNDALYQGNNFNADWTVIWDTQAVLTDYGWSMEMAIPFKTLPLDPNAQAWGFNVSRAIRRNGEEVLWVSRNRSWSPSIVGELRGIHDVDQGKGLDIVPTLVAGQNRLAGSPGRSSVEPSLDVYYRLTPSLNGSLTLNTDFSATEVDDRQVNLTRFGLFFPEKRDFFLNDADLFDFGRIGTPGYLGEQRSVSRASQESGRPFFSRRIGLSGAGSPVDLQAGGKLSGRIGNWRVGALAVHQDGYRRTDGSVVDPATLGVMRVSADVLAESSVGFIGTTGNASSNASASLVGFDFLYLNTRLPGGRTLESEAWFQQSQGGNVGTAGDRSAFGMGLRLPNADGWRGAVAFKQIGAGFDPALGFVSRRGVRDVYAEAGHVWNHSGGLLRMISSSVDAERIDGLEGGGLQSQVIHWRPLEVETHGRDKFETFLSRNEEVLAVPFTIYSDVNRSVVLPAGRYVFHDGGVFLDTGTQRELSGRAFLRRGEFYDGHRTSVGAGLTWRPSGYVALGGGYDVNDIELPAGHFRTQVMRATTEVSFNSKWSWTTLVQYDTVSEVMGFQSRLLWIPKAGQEFFLVANHSLQDIDKDGRFIAASTDVSAKVAYTLRF